MRPNLFRAALCVALSACVPPSAFADVAVTHQVGGPTIDLRASAHTAPVAKSLSDGNAASLPASRTAEAYANPFRAYPPSCLESPMALGMYSSDPYRLQTTLRLPGDPLGGATEETSFSEVETVTVFRVVCSSGESATLLEIDRPANVAAYPYPVFPGVYVTLSDGSAFVLRLSNDPNTFLATVSAFNPLYYSDVFVLENYFDSNQPQFDFNKSFTLNVDNLMSGSAHDVAQFNLGTYLPSSYPEASEALKINGYMSGNWYDPAHSGEGVQVEVGELTYPSRFITIAWYTYDDMGIPYWLFGSSGFTIGDRDVIVTLGYSSDGGFAGNFGSSVTTSPWGTFNVSFSDCNTMNFIYTSGSNLPSPVPQGTGTKSWKRATQLNGLTCQ